MVPEEAYSSSYLREEPLDKSYDFISQCAAHGYHIRWAGLGAGDGGVQRCGWLAAGLTPTPPQPLRLVRLLPQCRHLPLALLQQWGSAVRLPRGGLHGPHMRAFRGPVSLPRPCHRPRLLPLCHGLLGLPQLQA